MNVGQVEAILKLRDEMSAQLLKVTKNLTAVTATLEKMGAAATTAGSKLGGISKAASGAGAGIHGATGNMSKFIHTIDEMGMRAWFGGMGLTATFTVPLVAAGAAAFKFSSDFSMQMAKIETLSGKTRQEVDGFRESILDLAGETGKAPLELAEGMFFLASSTLTSKEATEALTYAAQASAIGLGETSTVARAVGFAIAAYGSEALSAKDATNILALAVREGNIEASEMASVMGRVIPMASMAGVAFADVAGAMAAMSQTGNNAAMAAVGLNQFLTLLAKGPTEKGGKILDKVGLSMQKLRDIARGPGGLVEAMRVLARATQDYSEEALATVVPEVRALRAVLSLTTQDMKKVDEVMRQVASGTDVLGAGMARLESEPGFRLNQVLAQLKIRAIELGDALSGVTMQVLEWASRMTESLQGLTAAFAAMPDSVKSSTVAVLGFAAALGPVLFIVGQMLTGLSGLYSIFGKLGPLLSSFSGWLKGGVVTAGVVAAITLLTKSIGAYLDLAREAAEISRATDLASKSMMVFQQYTEQTSKSIVAEADEIRKGLKALDERESTLKRSLKLNLWTNIVAVNKALGEQTGQQDLLNAALARQVELLKKIKLEESGRLAFEEAMDEAMKREIARLGEVEEAAKEMTEEQLRALNKLKGFISKFSDWDAAAELARDTQLALNKAQELGVGSAHDYAMARIVIAKALRESDPYYKTEVELLKLEVKMRDEASEAARKYFKEAAPEKYADMIRMVKEITAWGAKYKKTQDEITDAIRRSTQAWREANWIEDTTSVLHEAEVLAARVIADRERQLAVERELVKLYGTEFIPTAEHLTKALLALGGPSAKWIQNTRTAFDEYAADLKEIAEAQLTVEERALAIQDATERFWAAQLNTWLSALDYLAGIFGGFFGELAELGRGFQGALEFGKQIQTAVTNIAQQIGKSKQTASAMGMAAGYVATTFAVFAMIYDYVDKWIKKRKSQRYGNIAELTIVGGDIGTTTLEQRGFEVVNAIKDVVRQFEDALSGTVTDLTKIGIRIRNDGKYVAAYVNEVMIGHFEDVDSAIKAALNQVILEGGLGITGISDLVQQGIGEWTAPDFDSMMAFLGDLRTIAELDWSDGQKQLNETVRGFDRLWESLSKLRDATPAVLKGFQDLIAAELDAWQSERDAITGRERSAAEELKLRQAQALMWNAEKALRIAELKVRLETLKGLVRINQGQGRLGQAELERDLTFLDAKARLYDAEVRLMGGFVEAAGVTLSAGAELVNAEIAAIQQLLDALAAMSDIQIGEIRLHGVTGGGGISQTASDMQQLRDLLDQMAFDRLLANMGNLEGQLASLDRWYAEQLELVHGNAELMAALNAEYAAQQQLLQQQVQIDVAEQFQDFLGIGTGPISQLTDQFHDLQQQILDAGYGAERTERMLKRLEDAYWAQIAALIELGRAQALSPVQEWLDQVAGIGDWQRQLMDLQSQFDDAAQALIGLANDAKEAGLATDWLAGDLADLEAASHLAIQALGVDFIGSLTALGVSLPTDVVMELAYAQWQLAKAGAIASALAIAAAGGFEGLSITLAEILALIEGADFDISDYFPEIPNPRPIQQVNDAIDDWMEQLKRAREILLEFYNETFRGGGAAAYGTVSQKYNAAMLEYQRILALYRGGDLSQASALTQSAQTLIDLAMLMFGTTTGGFAGIWSMIESDIGGLLGITPGQQANPVADAADRTTTAVDNLSNVVDINSRRQLTSLDNLNSRSAEGNSELREIRRAIESLGNGTTGTGWS